MEASRCQRQPRGGSSGRCIDAASIETNRIFSENRQCACNGVETAIGQAAYDAASVAVQKLFGTRKKVANLDYIEATEALADEGDDSAKQARSAVYASTPAVTRSDERMVRPHASAGVTTAGQL